MPARWRSHRLRHQAGRSTGGDHGRGRSPDHFQFLLEAVVLCLLGGAIGVGIGSGGAMLISRLFAWNTSISSQSVVMAFAFSAVVGVVFGVWPARRASKLDPIMALRYE